MSKAIELWGVKQNNLKNIDIAIPLKSFTVICGPSGSGKSSLAFETLYAEGQRRYIESLSSYARQFLGKAPKPDIQGVKNIPPAIAIEQKNSVRTSRSTVGTATEITDYLRLLFEKIGKAHCPTYGFVVKKDSTTDATNETLQRAADQRGYVLAEIQNTTRIQTGLALQKLIIQDGFKRIYVVPAAKGTSGGKRKVRASSASISGSPCLGPNGKVELPAGGTQQLSGEIIELPDVGSKKLIVPNEKFYVVVDRLGFSEAERSRIADSIEQSYHVSRKYHTQSLGGKCTILLTTGEAFAFSEDNSCTVCGFTFPQVSSQLFSFSSPVGACPTCNGFGNLLTLDIDKIIPNKELSIAQGAIQPLAMPSAATDRRALLAFCRSSKIPTDVPWRLVPKAQQDLVFNGSGKWYGVVGLFEYLETKKYKMHVRVFLSRYKSPSLCPSCHGTRLRPESHYFKVNGKTLGELSDLTIEQLRTFINEIRLTPAESQVAEEILRQISSRLGFLCDVGVEYLSLARPTKSISGGEYQRLTLAKQLGMGLSQTLYVLDEPTIGLHPRDNDRLIGILQKLNSLGNTLVVVEHDHDVIQQSQHIIEMGPGSGKFGGTVIYNGPTAGFAQCRESQTYPFLNKHGLPDRAANRRPTHIATHKFCLELENCSGFNLKNINLRIPLRRLVAITGVSGSGKSTLITQTLYPALAEKLKTEFLPKQPCKTLLGWEHLREVILIDQSAVGKTARSTPVTYLKVYDAIRALMAATPEARTYGFTAGSFSLNVDGGRCPVCKGLGYEEIDMVFMDDVLIPCDVCDGKKFIKDVLEVRYKQKNIHEILRMTVAEALDFFVAHPQIRKPLSLLREVGLDYLALGQPASTLSGGESQRLKIARQLLQSQQSDALYILDEPTTGLHFKEVALLIGILNKLVDGGASVLLIEHNMDVIGAADYIIDLGPEAGARGGEIVAQGAPEEVVEKRIGHTARFLARYWGLTDSAPPRKPSRSARTLGDSNATDS